MFGVGPFYVLTCLTLIIIVTLLKINEYSRKTDILTNKIYLFLFGFILITLGIFLWIKTVVIQKISEEIKQGKLVTSGVYAYVRNPIYSTFLLIFTGIIILLTNRLLLLLPIIFWIFLTLLMKYIEEKWLEEKFKNEYIDYCKKVNRVIPWFKRK